jgi:hypothetical protein
VLPAELAIAPGVEYFVEALDADGSAAAAYGSDAAPARSRSTRRRWPTVRADPPPHPA